MAVPNVVDDPFASAADPQIRPAEYFGELQIDAWYAVLQKGVGKVPFDASQHDISKRVTALRVSILPIAEHNMSRDVSRELIAESREWAGIILPSIKDAWKSEWGNFSLAAVSGKYAKACFAPTGSTYTDKNGETKPSTTLKIMAMYGNETECRTAFLTGNGNGNGHNAPSSTGQSNVQPPAAQPAGPGPAVSGPAATQQPLNGVNPKELETAKKFLSAYLRQYGQDETALATAIAKAPIISKFFTVEGAARELLREKVLEAKGDLDKITAAIAGHPLLAKYCDLGNPAVMNFVSDIMFEQV